MAKGDCWSHSCSHSHRETHLQTRDSFKVLFSTINSEKLPADNKLILHKLSCFFNKTKTCYCGKENETKGIAFPWIFLVTCWYVGFFCSAKRKRLLLLSKEEKDSILHFTPIAVTTRLFRIGLLYVCVFCAGRWGWGWSLYALFCLLFFCFYFKKNRLLFLRK